MGRINTSNQLAPSYLNMYIIFSKQEHRLGQFIVAHRYHKSTKRIYSGHSMQCYRQGFIHYLERKCFYSFLEWLWEALDFSSLSCVDHVVWHGFGSHKLLSWCIFHFIKSHTFISSGNYIENYFHWYILCLAFCMVGQ